MPTPTEKLIRASRVQNDTVLVSKLNEILKMNIGIETEADANFLFALAMKQVEREKIRKSGGSVYSPSGLASCLRRVYLGAHWKELGFDRVELPSIEAHFYFLTGDFIHLKWQFALYKLSMIDPDFTLIDVEVPVISKRGDHGGTIDVVCLNEGELQLVDVKGLNRRGFYSVDEQRTSIHYRIQLTDYMMLWNSGVTHGLIKPTPAMKEEFGWDAFPKVYKGIILAENKGGPDSGHPAALTEQVVKLKDSLPDVRNRLELLRAHEEEKTLPEIECRSTKGIEFQGCPFADYCKKEIKAVERADAKSDDATEYRVAQPKRSNRSRRPRPK
jgi:hypothetical protein